MQIDDINQRFDYHAPNAERKELHETMRAECRMMAFRIDAVMPDSREKSTAITKLEEVMFWVNAGIARLVP